MKQLKKNQADFEVVEGSFKGHRYIQGTQYKKEQIPPQERKRFVPVPEVKTSAAPTAKTETKA